jgi:hypothetical protein
MYQMVIRSMPASRTLSRSNNETRKGCKNNPRCSPMSYEVGEKRKGLDGSTWVVREVTRKVWRKRDDDEEDRGSSRASSRASSRRSSRGSSRASARGSYNILNMRTQSSDGGSYHPSTSRSGSSRSSSRSSGSRGSSASSVHTSRGSQRSPPRLSPVAERLIHKAVARIISPVVRRTGRARNPTRRLIAERRSSSRSDGRANRTGRVRKAPERLGWDY